MKGLLCKAAGVTAVGQLSLTGSLAHLRDVIMKHEGPLHVYDMISSDLLAPNIRLSSPGSCEASSSPLNRTGECAGLRLHLAVCLTVSGDTMSLLKHVVALGSQLLVENRLRSLSTEVRLSE